MLILDPAGRPVEKLKAELRQSESDEIIAASNSLFYRFWAYLHHHKIKARRKAVNADTISSQEESSLPSEEEIALLWERMPLE